MNHERVKVLFIAGNGRSGSTILGVALGQLKGFFAGGELRRIWERGLIENRVCGCTEPFNECATWCAIYDRAYGGMKSTDPRVMLRYSDRLTQTKHLPMMLLRRNKRTCASDDQEKFQEALDKLYAAIHQVTGCKVIVDASKWPMYAYMLDRLPSVELYVLHLTRDPRASAFSWSRNKFYEEGRAMPKQGAFRSTLYWLAWNPAITYLWNRPGARYMFLAYERFVREPQNVMTEIARFVGEEGLPLPFIDANTLQLERTHAVAGNEARLACGPVVLKADDEWKQKLSRSDWALVSAMTWPLLLKYGYA